MSASRSAKLRTELPSKLTKQPNLSLLSMFSRFVGRFTVRDSLRTRRRHTWMTVIRSAFGRCVSSTSLFRSSGSLVSNTTGRSSPSAVAATTASMAQRWPERPSDTGRARQARRRTTRTSPEQAIHSTVGPASCKAGCPLCCRPGANNTILAGLAQAACPGQPTPSGHTAKPAAVASGAVLLSFNCSRWWHRSPRRRSSFRRAHLGAADEAERRIRGAALLRLK